MTSDRLPLGRMLAIFLAVIVPANGVLVAFGYLFPDLPQPSAMGLVIAMVAAMSAGQSATKSLNRRLVFSEKAIFAVLATLLSSALGVAVLWALFAWHGVPFTLANLALVMTQGSITSDEFITILAWVVPIALLLTLFMTYFGAAMGSRSQIKLEEKLAAKG